MFMTIHCFFFLRLCYAKCSARIPETSESLKKWSFNRFNFLWIDTDKYMTIYCYLFSGLCYAECSTRIPRTGSSYVYTYATLGELCAFVVGWSMILENMLGVAATAKAWSQYIDVFFNGSIHR